MTESQPTSAFAVAVTLCCSLILMIVCCVLFSSPARCRFCRLLVDPPSHNSHWFSFSFLPYRRYSQRAVDLFSFSFFVTVWSGNSAGHALVVCKGFSIRLFSLCVVSSFFHCFLILNLLCCFHWSWVIFFSKQAGGGNRQKGRKSGMWPINKESRNHDRQEAEGQAKALDWGTSIRSR